jgi:hypothetical protein
VVGRAFDHYGLWLNPFYKPPEPEGPSIRFLLPNDNAIEIRLKKPVSKKDFDRIIKLVQLSEDSLVEQASGAVAGSIAAAHGRT